MDKLLHHSKEAFGVLIRHSTQSDLPLLRRAGTMVLTPGPLVPTTDPVYLKISVDSRSPVYALDIVGAQGMQTMQLQIKVDRLKPNIKKLSSSGELKGHTSS